MRKVSVKYFASLKEQSRKNSEDYATKATSVGDLYLELKTRYRFTLPPDVVRVAVNERFERMDYELQQGDRVAFIPPVSGG